MLFGDVKRRGVDRAAGDRRIRKAIMKDGDAVHGDIQR